MSARAHFFPGQFLRAQDFADEQAYHLALHRRHNIAHHIWGIVAGLDLGTDEEGNLAVQAGVAVDGFGRELVLAQRQGVGRQPFDDRAADVLDVYLNYGRSGGEGVPAGFGGCDDDNGFYRWQEQPFLTFEEPATPPVDRRRPDGVLEPDADFASTGTPPDEPERRWPVFLGTVTLDRADDRRPFAVDPAGRPYAGLVGQSVLAASGSTTVQIGAGAPGDSYRFAVHVPEAETVATADKPRLALTHDQKVEVRGDTTIQGNLTIEGAIELTPGANITPTSAPLPRIYRVGTDLRVEMDAAGTHQFVVGTWSADDDQFRPCLTITNDGTVTVHGDLVVEGTTDGITISADAGVQAGLGTEAQQLAVGAFASGMAGASTLLGTPGGATPAPDLVIVSLAALQTAAQVVAAFPERAAAFADLLRRAHPQAAQLLRDALAEEPRAGGGPP